MKTFDEHKKRPRTFVEIIDENEKDLIKDLENLSIKEETFSIDDITDTWDTMIIEDNFTGEHYCTIKITESFDTDVDNYGDHSSFTVQFTGSIDVEDVDTVKIVKEFIENLESNDDNYKQKRWTTEEITEALEYVAWQDYLDIDLSELEAEIHNVSEDGAGAIIEYRLKEDSYFLSVDRVEMSNDFTGELGIE